MNVFFRLGYVLLYTNTSNTSIRELVAAGHVSLCDIYQHLQRQSPVTVKLKEFHKNRTVSQQSEKLCLNCNSYLRSK